MEILYKLLAAVLIAVIPILTGFICDLFRKAAQEYKEKANNERIGALVDEINSSVCAAVAYVNQTFVNELKASGVFGEDETYAKEAFEMAFRATVETISDAASQYILETFGDIRKYLEVKIEQEVLTEKKW